MDEITVYHQGEPISRHMIERTPFYIGSQKDNDLIIPQNQVEESRLAIYKDDSGKWYSEMNTGCINGRKKPVCSEPIKLGKITLKIGFSDFNKTLNDKYKIIGASRNTNQLNNKINRICNLKGSVLITGQTGTGKELIAKNLHYKSKRAERPFIALNCGSLTETLLEDTMFGHERGAFTGAVKSQEGLFEQADRGTLFLDEIGELPLAFQPSLLRILDDGIVTPIGSNVRKKADFRIIAATNKDILQMVENGTFREDLFYRINALQISTVPLCERLGDIVPLARHFLKNMKNEVGLKNLHIDAIAKLKMYKWPGNVREFKNILYKSAAFCPEKTMYASSIKLPMSFEHNKTIPFRKMSNNYLMYVISQNDGNFTIAAKHLGVARTSLRDRIKRIQTA